MSLSRRTSIAASCGIRAGEQVARHLVVDRLQAHLGNAVGRKPPAGPLLSQAAKLGKDTRGGVRLKNPVVTETSAQEHERIGGLRHDPPDKGVEDVQRQDGDGLAVEQPASFEQPAVFGAEALASVDGAGPVAVLAGADSHARPTIVAAFNQPESRR